MKRVILLFSLMTIFLFVTEAYTQGLKFGVGGGLSIVQSPDVLTNSVAEGGSGFGSEYHFGAKVKLSLPLVPVVPVAFINYHMLSGESDHSQSILSIGAGIQYNLIPGPLSPYASIDLQYNSFGDAELGDQTLPGITRTGLGLGAGVEFTLIPMLDFDVSAKYNMLNLMGKEEGEETIGLITLNLTVMFGGI